MQQQDAASQKGKSTSKAKTQTVEFTVEQALALIINSLDDSKAEEIVPIDVRGKTPLTDHLVIASGRSHRHVGAIADHLLRDLKEAGLGSARVEGLPSCDWVLVDTGDAIVHIFRPEVREFYNIEKMWATADLSAEDEE